MKSQQRDTCVLSLILLCLHWADAAIVGYKTIADLMSKRPPPGSTICRFRIEPEMAEIPIMRRINPDGKVSATKILTAGCLAKQILGVGQRAGYEEPLTPYCFRRGFGNNLDKVATPAQRRQLMGHSDDSIFQHYISSIVGLDSQSFVQGKQQHSELIDYARSMSLGRNTLAPQPPRSTLIEPIRPYTQDFLTPTLSPSKAYDRRRQLQKKKYLDKRQNFFKGDGDRTPAPEKCGENYLKPEKDQRSPSRYLKLFFGINLIVKFFSIAFSRGPILAYH
ncbi:hypothetical protein GQ43DRAFT_29730 [Delitschia confertaspora ATCC 74209]|uniref:Tyr recombinase domain-containing protein n=1 Tax=Delitschia confertaspora ATCC 74209 TaxID=1513339 RepID=A0A9P4JR64_9PLEO|nr:hypothetical protein GQ43DRAFT_29730 [Delitschia confertaspora ATCC 74209]